MSVGIEDLNIVLVPRDPQLGIGSMRPSHLVVDSSYLSSHKDHYSLMLMHHFSEPASSQMSYSQLVSLVFGCGKLPAHFAIGALQVLGPACTIDHIDIVMIKSKVNWDSILLGKI